MMDNLRAAANNVVLKVLLALIMLSFVLTGVGSYMGSDSQQYAAEVNGQEISRANFEQALAGERGRLQQQLGEQFSQLASNEGYMKQLRQQVLNRMVNDILLDQYATKIGLMISDDQVKLAIQLSPEFQTDGKFDNAKYLSLLNRFQYQPAQYAELMRKQLLTQQLLEGYSGTNFALPSEAQSVIALIDQKRDIRTANIDMKALAAQKDAEPTEQEIKDFYEQNKSRFTAPESVKIDYIEVDAASLTDSIKVTDEEIAEFYTQNKPMYMQKPRSNYSIIVLENENDAKAVLEQLKSGANFADVAKQKSIEKDSAAKGGELGWLEASAVTDDIAKAKLTEKGQISGIIPSDVGYLIVRLNDFQPEQQRPLADVKAEIAQNLLQDKSYNQYEDLQTKLIDGAASNKLSLEDAEKASGLKTVQSDWFTRDSIPQELSYPEIAQEIFGGELFGVNGAPGPNSDVITVDGDRAFVLRIAEHRPEAIKPFEQVSADIAELLKRQKVLKMAREQADKLLAALNTDKADEALKAANVKFGDKQVITRRSDDAQLADAVFALAPPKDGKPTYGVSMNKDDQVVLVALDAIDAGVLPDEEAKAFGDELVKQTSGVILDSLVSNLRQQAKIKMGDIGDAQ